MRERPGSRPSFQCCRTWQERRRLPIPASVGPWRCARRLDAANEPTGVPGVFGRGSSRNRTHLPSIATSRSCLMTGPWTLPGICTRASARGTISLMPGGWGSSPGHSSRKTRSGMPLAEPATRGICPLPRTDLILDTAVPFSVSPRIREGVWLLGDPRSQKAVLRDDRFPVRPLPSACPVNPSSGGLRTVSYPQ